MPPKYSREIDRPIVFGAQLKAQFRTSPCEAACPLGTSIQKMESLVEAGEYTEALRYVRAKNPFPGITGRVCPHFCMDACNRSHKDGCVNVRALERAVQSYGDSTEALLRRCPATGKKVSVIGGGPAGLSAAYYLSLLGHEATVYEAEPVLGGVPRYGVPHFRLPRHVVDSEVGMVLQSGVRAYVNTRVGKDITFAEIRQRADAVIIASGAPAENSLPIPGAEHALKAMQFLRAAALGQANTSSVAGKSVVIMGGGGVGFDCAFTARRLGAAAVHVICLEESNAMRAPAEDLSLAREEGIHIHHACTLSAIRSRQGTVIGVDYYEVSLCSFDEKGSLTLEARPGGQHELACDTVIFAVGMKTDLSFLGEGAESLPLTPRGYILTDAEQTTGQEGIFAAGDVARGPASIAAAVGDGRKAAFAAHIWLSGEHARVFALNANNVIEACDALAADCPPHVVQFEEIYGLSQYAPVRAQAEIRNACTQSFAELHMPLDRAAAEREAARCFHCGHCKGCGSCVEDCPGYVLELQTCSGKQRPQVAHGDECWHCANCRISCPCGAIGFQFPLRMQV